MKNPWEVEEVPSDHFLYKFVKERFVRNGELLAEVFRNVGEPNDPSYGMSTDWCKYSTPEETKIRPTDKTARYGVARIRVGEVATIEQQYVAHDPLFFGDDHPENNRAHTNIKGPKGSQDGLDRPTSNFIRIKFVDLFEVIIEP